MSEIKQCRPGLLQERNEVAETASSACPTYSCNFSPGPVQSSEQPLAVAGRTEMYKAHHSETPKWLVVQELSVKCHRKVRI